MLIPLIISQRTIILLIVKVTPAILKLMSDWNNRHACSDLDISDLDISKCSSKPLQTVKENSLKEKLLEARLGGRNACLKALKGYSLGGLQ